MGSLAGAATLRRPPFIMAYFRQSFLFGHPKRKRKRCPLLPTAREARLRGCSPLRTPKRRSRSKKAKKRRSAAFFFTLFHFSPIDPSEAKFSSTNHSVGTDACCCGVAQRSMPQWGIEPHEWASSAGCRPSFWPTNGPAPGRRQSTCRP